jgi:curli biogenesis system outer membrane secretion channel CsgG
MKMKREFIGIINYSIMALIQLELRVVDQPDLEVKKQLNYTMQSQTDQRFNGR